MIGLGVGELIILLLVVFVGVPALLVVLGALLPRYLERSGAVLRAHPGRSALLGLLNMVVLLGLAWLLSLTRWPPLEYLGVFLFGFVLPASLVLGLLVTAHLVGETVWGQLAKRPINLLAALLLGTVLLALVLLVPIVGWLLVPVLILIGLGAALAALVPGRRPSSGAAGS